MFFLFMVFGGRFDMKTSVIRYLIVEVFRSFISKYLIIRFVVTESFRFFQQKNIILFRVQGSKMKKSRKKPLEKPSNVVEPESPLSFLLLKKWSLGSLSAVEVQEIAHASNLTGCSSADVIALATALGRSRTIPRNTWVKVIREGSMEEGNDEGHVLPWLGQPKTKVWLGETLLHLDVVAKQATHLFGKGGIRRAAWQLPLRFGQEVFQRLDHARAFHTPHKSLEEDCSW